jgi:hypothetical protein
MNTTSRLLAAALLVASAIPAAQAADIAYTATPLGGANWRYDYVVTNDDLVGLDEFSVFFDRTSYSNLVVAASPAGWSSIALQPTAALDGLFDSLALNSSLPMGASLGGFSVSFTWLAQGMPGIQPFQVIDPFNGNAVLQTGMTIAAIPEPQSLALLLAGIVPLAWWARRRRAA